LSLTDGENVLPLACSRTTNASATATPDLNTGGMGAYSPAPVRHRRHSDRNRDGKNHSADRCWYESRRNTPYKGVLYAGLMLTTKARS
jgi:phosphoribosylamine--glycine ligase